MLRVAQVEFLPPIAGGEAGVTIGAPAIVDPTDPTKIITTDNADSLAGTHLIGIVAGEALGPNGERWYSVQTLGVVDEVNLTNTIPGQSYWAAAGGTGFTTTDPGLGICDPLYVGKGLGGRALRCERVPPPK